MHRGYIKLYRKMTEWEWYKNIPVRVLFEHCLIKANIKDKKWQGIIIKKGSFITSLDNLAFETGLTKRQIRTAIEKLKSTHEMTYQPTRHYSMIAINNYDLYQGNDTPIDTQVTHKRHTDDTQMTLTKECKEYKNDKNISFIGEKTKKLDPYINPIKDFFISEYRKEFEKKPYLSNQDCNRLVELAADNPDIRDLIPEAIKRLKSIKFDDINFKPTASWLLKGNNFERVMNGEFERQKTPAELYRERRERCENS